MTLFGHARLGRLSYAILFLLIAAFDFVKDPVERALMAAHDSAVTRMMEPKPVVITPGKPAPVIDQDFSPLLGSQRAAMERMKALGRPLTDAEAKEFEEDIRREAQGMLFDMGDFGNADPETRDAAWLQGFLFQIYPLVQLLMGAISIFGVLYLVSGRVRDIGWPQFAVWLVLAPLLLPRFVPLPMSQFLVPLLSGFGLLVLVAIALVPSGGFGSSDEDRDDPPPPGPTRGGNRPPGSRPGKPRQGQFGKLGVNR